MDIWETSKLAFFIAFVVPGFISLKTYGLLSPRESKSTADQLIDAVAYSSINYALLLWPIYSVETSGTRLDHPTAYIVFYVFVLLIAPISWACLFLKLRTTKFFRGAMPHPTAKPWDYIFSQQKPYWIIVTLKDGTQIGGLYNTQSFASSAPAPEQLYLEEAWKLNADGGFERPRVDSAGIMILTLDMVTVEFFNITSGIGNDKQEAIERRLPASEGGEGLPAGSAA
ncbi:DUF6338 family protein [Castellaniella sp.]|uniref:DUF6338 family protein n=1 Tax=Castellaniella sp. TaxID=1955812 RepID=UPI0025BEBA1E|nr:DUF6338 family protein [Castellaniella sp.]